MKKEYGIRERKSMATRVLAICVMTALVFAGTAMGAVSRDGLVGEWHFDGDAKDTSGNGNDGTIYGETFVDGVRGKALSFDGNGYVAYGDVIDLTGKFTLEAWVYLKSGGAYRHFIKKERTGANEQTGYGLALQTVQDVLPEDFPMF